MWKICDTLTHTAGNHMQITAWIPSPNVRSHEVHKPEKGHNANPKLCAYRRYEAEQEEAMEEAYQSYLERQGQRAKAARAKRARLGKTGDLGSDEEADDDVEPAPVPELRVRGLHPLVAKARG